MKRFALAISIVAALSLASVALAAGPNGTYKTKITSNAVGGHLKGTWTIKFKSGAYTVTDNGTVVIHGKYTVSGSTMTLVDKTGPDKCPGRGKYKFSITGSSLKFTKVSDTSACVGRITVLTSKTLTKIA
jgi:hypothetical protein